LKSQRIYSSPLFLLIFTLAVTAPSRAGDLDLQVVNRIKDQAFNHSQVMTYVEYLADENGPRLAASPEYQRAANWTVDALKKAGIKNAHIEPSGEFGRSWSWSSIAVQMLSPLATTINAVPLAWSDSTHGTLEASAIYAPLWEDDQDPGKHDLVKLAEKIAAYKTQYSGQLANKVVLLSAKRSFKLPSENEVQRWTESDLSKMLSARDPLTEDLYQWPRLNYPLDIAKRWQMYEVVPAEIQTDYSDRKRSIMDRLVAFLKSQGVAAIMMTNSDGHGGVIFAEKFGSWKASAPVPPTALQVMPEHYNRLVRLLQKDIAVTLSVNVEASFPQQNAQLTNVLAELPGKKKPKDIVMMGAHLDSWHSGTGATDNATGVAIVMEAMRILSTLELNMDRTVRLGLWDGEELGYLGSRAYVRKYLGESIKMQLKPLHQSFSAYFNIDTGSGKTRGILTQGNDMVRPIFEKVMQSFKEYGISTISPRNDWGTDHVAFDAVGLPAFNLLQDQLDYWSHTHHSNIDTLDHVVAKDLMVSAAFLATLVYQSATIENMLPREPLPSPLPAPGPLPEILKN
jgi:hypothetical protein